jgi:hypothetical protein
VGGGSLWATVEKEAIKHGLASVAGTVNHVCCSAHRNLRFMRY